MRVEEERKPIVKDPVRARERFPALFDRFLVDVEAPVTFGIDRRIRIAQNVADISAKIENVFPAPVRIAELCREISRQEFTG
jgi:hypothetical protein